MSRELTKISLWATLVLCWVLCGARTVQAGLAFAPLKQEISLKPGETGKAILKVTNQIRANTKGSESATLQIVDVSVTDEGGLVFKDIGTQKNSASKWVNLKQKNITLEPGKNDVIEVEINVPIQTTPGEYYTAVMITLNALGHSDKGIDLQYQVVSGVFVTVLGQTLSKQAKITQCEMVWPNIAATSTTQPANSTGDTQAPHLVTLIKNTGQARFNATGLARIIDSNNRVVMTSLLTSNRPLVFGGDSRIFRTPISKPLPAGKYQAKVTLDFESSWTKLYQTINFEITPEQAAYLNRVDTFQGKTARSITITPSQINQSIPAGGSRTIGVGVRNITENNTRCLISISSGGETDIENWFTLAPTDFSLGKLGHQSVQINVNVPQNAHKGIYSALIAVESQPEGSELRRMEIPVEIQVKTER